ncbi:hypothetical protein HHI36_006915 [Cryptolaemus montrouzieri]|uniref:tRNA/rRNA methyltransferase SpoU type domain-containing protein n=1 Tax=Cryptolaemus montrouzieri TaxID=559131 RepID=A0ABD2MN66_9CUCU
MPYREMQLWSNLVTNPGMMGVFKIPEVKEVQYDIPVNVIFILTKGCCDIWNTKVLRSAMGAHFKLNIQKLGWEEMKEQLSGSNWFIADNNTITSSRSSTSIVDLVENISLSSYHSLKYSGSDEISLIIGGETEGISEEAFSLVASLGGLRINIPLGNDIESLNSSTALAVIIFEMKRQIKGVN